jgi:deazaflavin-dependent oxidoreductase (nitroreductase family)
LGGGRGPANRLFRAPVYLYHWRCGWLLGNRFLLLIHIGRRTGLRRETVLELVEYRNNGPEAVAISGFGPTADRLRNIAAMPNPEVVIGSHRFAATCRVLGEDEAGRVIESYERHHPFIAPIIRAVLSRLVDWTYTGSKEDRRKVARQLCRSSRFAHAGDSRFPAVAPPLTQTPFRGCPG